MTESAATDASPSSETAAAAVCYRMTLRYDGRAYHGWQRHPGKPTVQGTIEAAVEELCGQRCAVHGSGRTDRGVHADAQVAHFEVARAESDPPPEPESVVAERLSASLPADIELLDCRRVTLGFHAREDAVAKTYRYEIWSAPQCPDSCRGRVWHVRGALDFEAMRRAAPVLEGQHDFSSFAKKTNYQREAAAMVRHLYAVTLEQDGPHIVLRFRADGFLYKMVRNLVRALVKVGEGRYDAERLAQILDAKDRKAAPGTAPASGLHLQSVEYKE